MTKELEFKVGDKVRLAYVTPDDIENGYNTEDVYEITTADKSGYPYQLQGKEVAGVWMCWNQVYCPEKMFGGVEHQPTYTGGGKYSLNNVAMRADYTEKEFKDILTICLYALEKINEA